MKKKNLPPLPTRRYNKWCEKKGYPIGGFEDKDVRKKAIQMGLTDLERDAFAYHHKMNTEGFEFEVISNVEMDKYIEFDNGLILVPCFPSYEEWDGTPLDDPDTPKIWQMMETSRYEYDGWLQIKNWDKQSISKAIRSIDETLSGIPLLANAFFEWKPKYPTVHKPNYSTPIRTDENFNKLKINPISYLFFFPWIEFPKEFLQDTFAISL